jgi:uncharacterized protein (DUF1015 family)
MACRQDKFCVRLGVRFPIFPAAFMATIQPFAALRPDPALAARICELPYDVMSTEEARRLAAGNPLSFLHVSKPEIDLPPGTDPYAPAVYLKGRENFNRLIAEGALRKDVRPCLYLYRQTMGSHSQTGVVAAASCSEYLEGRIRKHEFTRPEKEEDRVRHLEALNAQTGPAFLTYRAVTALDEFVRRKSSGEPDVAFTAPDGVQHSAWTIGDREDIERIQTEFTRVPELYIADGHHRSAAAARVYRKRGGAGASAGFLGVLFPHDQLTILPYNRVLKDLNGLSTPQLVGRLDSMFVIQSDGHPAPLHPHQFGLYLDRRWHTLTLRPRFVAGKDAIEKLDTTLLQKLVLDPVFGISDPRRSERIQFVGGIRGTDELEKRVDHDGWACAFSLCPMQIDDLMAVADAGAMLPPKSTWFEPKLRDAMFCRLLE